MPLDYRNFSDMSSLVEKTDVLVIGAGTAGVVAAIQAARAGVRVTVIEMTGQPGGTITNSRVSAPGYFHAWGERLIDGIGWKLVEETKTFSFESMPDKDAPPQGRPDHYIPLNPYVYAVLSEKKMLEAGVVIHYHEVVTEIIQEDDDWLVTCVGKGLKRKVKCRELIDCTGDADIVGMLGFAREKADIRQPGTLRFQLQGYDVSTLDFDDIDQRYQAAMADARLCPGDYSGMDSNSFSKFLHARGMNQQHIFGADSSTSQTQSDANIAGRQSLLRLLKFIKSIPGCENTSIEWMAPMTGIRETYRIVGEKTITYEDYINGRVFDDALCYSIFFVDLHTDEGGHKEFLKPGIIPTIPFGALIPKGSRHLLVAGRCLSSDRLANSALRVEPSCMAMGQVVGAAAALGVKNNIPSRDIDINKIRALLKEHGAKITE
jgi:hypothetical protein